MMILCVIISFEADTLKKSMSYGNNKVRKQASFQSLSLSCILEDDCQSGVSWNRRVSWRLQPAQHKLITVQDEKQWFLALYFSLCLQEKKIWTVISTGKNRTFPSPFRAVASLTLVVVLMVFFLPESMAPWHLMAAGLILTRSKLPEQS